MLEKRRERKQKRLHANCQFLNHKKHKKQMKNHRNHRAIRMKGVLQHGMQLQMQPWFNKKLQRLLPVQSFTSSAEMLNHQRDPL